MREFYVWFNFGSRCVWLLVISVNMVDFKMKDFKKLDEFIIKVDEIEILVGNMWCVCVCIKFLKMNYE